MAFDDRTSSWWLTASGEWERHHLDEGRRAPLRDLQETLIAMKRRRRAVRSVEREVERAR